MERFCKDLKEHAVKIINYEKKEMIPLNEEENESYEKQNVCYICKKEFNTDEFDADENDKNEFNTDENDKNESNTDENGKNEFNTDENALKLYDKLKDHCHYTGKFRGAAYNICNLRYKTPKKFPVVFHNGSTYDYHFLNNQLAKEFKGQLECLGEKTENIYYFFSTN